MAMTIMNNMLIHGNKLEDIAIIENILQSLTSKFNYIIRLVEESKNTEVISINEVESSLVVHEKTNHDIVECGVTNGQALEALSLVDSSRSIGRGRGR